MSILILLLFVFVAGVVGGSINALISDNGFTMPQPVKVSETQTIYRPGFLGNALIGGFAACVSWGLYGPLAAVSIVGGSTPQGGLTLSALLGAALVGVGGARWLTNEVDKNLLHKAASIAQSNPASPEIAELMAHATAAGAYKLAKDASQTKMPVAKVSNIAK